MTWHRGPDIIVAGNEIQQYLLPATTCCRCAQRAAESQVMSVWGTVRTAREAAAAADVLQGQHCPHSSITETTLAACAHTLHILKALGGLEMKGTLAAGLSP